MESTIKRCERQYAIAFESIHVFTRDCLQSLGRKRREREHEGRVLIASQRNESISQDVEELGRVANKESLTSADRQRYLELLETVYRRLPTSPLEFEDSMVVAPEREGRMLAGRLGWLPVGRNVHPDAKRMWWEGGLLVGLSALPELACERFSRVAIVDGAIASGATIMALISEVVTKGGSVEVFSVHAAPEGVRSVMSLADGAGIGVRIVVGHVSGRLDAKYYAVNEAAQKSYVVGDLGDTIGPLDTIQ
ncbi:MAG TPA: hypothetical protein VGS57_19125 [Thermoanaerobaculia bacterium]|jgi:hypothetical protein|nr:hypothetical protein [Thermoanaerobaculia bacterium]